MPVTTVGQLRKLLVGLPDDAKILPDFAEIPNDDEPGVEIVALVINDIGGGPYLSVRVRLFYLYEDEKY